MYTVFLASGMAQMVVFLMPFGGVKNAKNGLKMCVWAVMLAPLLGDDGLNRVFLWTPSGPNMGAATFTETLPNAIYFTTFLKMGVQKKCPQNTPQAKK